MIVSNETNKQCIEDNYSDRIATSVDKQIPTNIITLTHHAPPETCDKMLLLDSNAWVSQPARTTRQTVTNTKFRRYYTLQ